MSKYIITSGCSYGKFGHSLVEFCDSNSEFILIDVSCPSQSSDYISDSIIYSVNFLLSNNVNPEDIFVIGEWTEFERMGVSPFSYNQSIVNKNTINDLMNITQVNGIPQKKSYELDKKFQVGYFKNSFLPIIENKLFFTANHLDGKNDFLKEIYYDVYHYKKITDNLTIEYYINRWFDNVLKTQYYLESKGIKYKFCYMYNLFSAWENSKNIKENIIQFDNTQKNIKSSYDKFLDYKNKSNDKKYHILNSFTDISYKFNQLDLSNWWFDKDFGFGGIDDFAIDKFGFSGYYVESFKKLKNYREIINYYKTIAPKFGHHPQPFVYYFILKDMLQDISWVNLNSEFEKTIQKDLVSTKSKDLIYLKKTEKELKDFYFKNLNDLIDNNTTHI